jgi:DNA/RNA-binding domain of Phe-tRNA-synthetase-like protein
LLQIASPFQAAPFAQMSPRADYAKKPVGRAGEKHPAAGTNPARYPRHDYPEDNQNMLWLTCDGMCLPFQKGEVMIQVSRNFRMTFPGARLGFLAMSSVANPPSHPLLEQRKAEIEESLRSQFGGFDRPRLKQLPIIRTYDNHYRKFDKAYHVLLQVESVALKGKSIPSVAALVEAMFMAELKNMLLTAGHDFSRVIQPLTLDVSVGGETYLGIRGKMESCKAGDMIITDGEGIISSVLYGPDARTRVTPETNAVLFTVYAPEGVNSEAVHAHLRDIEEYVRLTSPRAATDAVRVV